jgi:hypothetical protein
MAIINSQLPGGAEVANSPSESRVSKVTKSSPVNLILLFLVIGLTLYGVFLNFQKGGVLTNTSNLEKDVLALKAEVSTFKENKVEVSKNATDALVKIEAEEIRWSDVIAEVNQLIPSDASGKRQIEILSYSGSGQGRIALNAVTQASSIPLFDNVAKLIATFNNSVFFKDVYVPSISKGQNENGTSTLSFVLNMVYEKPETGSENLAPVVAAPESKVPRVQNK